jgi:hypothetical protein
MSNPKSSAIDSENLVRIIQTINFCSEGRTVAVVRVPSAHSDLLTHALDAGKCTYAVLAAYPPWDMRIRRPTFQSHIGIL